MSDVNVVVLSGRLVANPELRYTPKGTAVASLRLASNRFYRDRSQPESELKKVNLFITASVFGKTAERVSNFKKKGDPLLVRGRLELNEWKGEDGKPRQTYRLFAEDVTFMPRARKGDAPGGEESAAETAPAGEDEDIAF